MLDRSNIEINNPIYLRDYDEDEPTTHDGEGDAFTFNNDKSVRIEMSNSLMNSLALRNVHIRSYLETQTYGIKIIGQHQHLSAIF